MLHLLPRNRTLALVVCAALNGVYQQWTSALLKFATRGLCIKRKQARLLWTPKKFLIFNCSGVTLFTFYAVPSSGKLKGALVHSRYKPFLLHLGTWPTSVKALYLRSKKPHGCYLKMSFPLSLTRLVYFVNKTVVPLAFICFYLLKDLNRTGHYTQADLQSSTLFSCLCLRPEIYYNKWCEVSLSTSTTCSACFKNKENVTRHC